MPYCEEAFPRERDTFIRITLEAGGRGCFPKHQATLQKPHSIPLDSQQQTINNVVAVCSCEGLREAGQQLPAAPLLNRSKNKRNLFFHSLSRDYCMLSSPRNCLYFSSLLPSICISIVRISWLHSTSLDLRPPNQAMLQNQTMNIQELEEETPVSQGSSTEQMKKRGAVGVAIWRTVGDAVLGSLNWNQTTQKTPTGFIIGPQSPLLTSSINQQEMLPQHRMQALLSQTEADLLT